MELKTYGKHIEGQGELRWHQNHNTNLSLQKGELVRNEVQRKSGISARFFEKGAWGFASDSEVSPLKIEKTISAARKNADFLSQKNLSHGRLKTVNPFVKNFDLRPGKPAWKTQQLLDFLKALDSYIETTYPKLLSRTVSLRAIDMEKNLFTSFGSEAYSYTPRTHIVIQLTAPSPAGPVSLQKSFGGLGQFQDQFTQPETLYSKIDLLHEDLLKKAEGTQAEAGNHEVILDPDLAGILAHEAIGHTTEADLVLGGSVAGELLNSVVASPLVSLVDFAHTALGETCPVPVYIDDEGTETKDSVIIENGVLKTFMHNRETADHFESESRGHARAFDFFDEPLIRMRNTAILPGKSKISDMISSIEKGYYLKSPANGQADTTSEFMFGVAMGYEIKNGKLGRAIRDTTISGVAFDMLKSVKAVSDDFAWESAGYCGKKQIMPVGMAGPAIQCRIHIGGQ